MAPQPGGPGTATLRIFVDRSIMEVYSGGAAMTSRIGFKTVAAATAAIGVDLWCDGGSAKLLALDAWPMASMWGAVAKNTA